MRRIANSAAIVIVCVTLMSGCAGPEQARTRGEAGDARGAIGLASFYGSEFRGRLTASGERYDPSQLTAAHRSFPFGTQVRVRNLDNGKSIVVRINDRGPYKAGRIIDLSFRAAKEIGLLADGISKVSVTVEER